MPRLDRDKKYLRRSGVVYDVRGTALVRLDTYFPDIDRLTPEAIDYLNKYLTAYTDRQQYYPTMQGQQIIFFYDLETTGTDPRKHSIHQIAGLIEVDGVVVERFDIRTQPHPKAIIEPEALAVAGVTEEQVRAYPPMQEAYTRLMSIILKYIDRYNPADKMYRAGYNIAGFDDPFLEAWFKQIGDKYLMSYFHKGSLDTIAFASWYLMKRRAGMENFKLLTVARTLGIEVDESRLHDAVYDIEIAREVYMICTGLEIEM